MSASYRFALHAYPPEYRDQHGDELVATANELTSDRWSFQQSRSFFAAGLQARAFATSKGEAHNLWGQATLTAMGLMESFFMWTTLAYLLGIRGGVTRMNNPEIALALSIVFLGFFCTHVRSWVAPLLALRVALAGVLSGELDFHRGDAAIAIGTLLLCTSIWVTARRTTATRAFSPRTAIGLVVVGLATAALVDESSGSFALIAMLIVGVAIPGLVLFRIDPRPAATVVAFVAISQVFTVTMAILSPGFVDRQILILLAVSLTIAVVFTLLARSGMQRLHHQAI